MSRRLRPLLSRPPRSPACRRPTSGIHGSEVASADAIRSSEATLVPKARRRQRAFGGAWEDVMRLAVLVRDGVQRPGMESLEVIWRDPETRTVAQAADAAVKKLAVGVSREQILEDLGYSPVQIERMAPAPLRPP
jgi:hypothetical protein